MLSEDALKRIDREIAKYPPQHAQSAVMSALAIAQDEKGWLSTETMDFVAQYLGMPPIAVYEVATFYDAESEVRLEQLTTTLEPAILVVMGGVVVTILLAIYLPIIQSISNGPMTH